MFLWSTRDCGCCYKACPPDRIIQSYSAFEILFRNIVCSKTTRDPHKMDVTISLVPVVSETVLSCGKPQSQSLECLFSFHFKQYCIIFYPATDSGFSKLLTHIRT